MKRFAYVTDLHLDESFPAQHHVNAKKNWQRVLDDIKDENISHIIIGGDVGETSSHEWFFSTVNDFSLQFTPGNHDSYDVVKKHLSLTSSGSGELYYRLEEASFIYLFLDSSSGCLSLQQLQWLNEALETDKSVVLFIHHPVLEVATKADTLYPLQNRDEVRKCLVDSELAITIFCGHYHLPDDQHVGNIRQIISPAVSFQILKSADQLLIDSRRFGYRLVSCKNDGTIETTVKMFKNDLPGSGVTAL